MLVINTNNYAVPVKIQTPDGEDVVHIQARGRVNLGEGRSVDANWHALNGQGIKLPVTPKSNALDSEE